MKYKNIVDQMTLEEKAAYVCGKNEWQTRAMPKYGVPSIQMSDGPNGIRRQMGDGDHLGLNPSLPATCFPTEAMVAASWDQHLGEVIGEALGEEACKLGVDVLLGPGLNIKRGPLCGRNFEYFSEDPYLSGKMAAAYIRGIQKKGIMACPKHFAVNNQELRRMSINAVVDERTLREIYLTAFEMAIKEGHAKWIMSSYNRINGEYANENVHLIKEILRREWGFEGVVVTDWGGSNDSAKGIRAGSNLEMPNPGLDSARRIVGAVKTGELAEKDLDESVAGILDTAFSLKANGEHKVEGIEQLSAQHHELARKIAAESAILLKNEEEILPLPEQTKVALIGDFAANPRYQGAGSSAVNVQSVDTIEKLIGGYELEVTRMAQGYVRTGRKSTSAARKERLEQAVECAKKADVILFCFGLDESTESEGVDRTHMKIPSEQIEVLEAVARVNPNIVGILSAGSPVEMPWIGCCKALLHGYLYGEAGAGAMLDIITGKVNPSGRVAETYPLVYEDTPACAYFPGMERNAEHREGLYVGYRYYTTNKKAVLFPFGYGLGYTRFTYRELKVSEEGASLLLKNVGEREGAEVVQLYVSKPDTAIFRPGKELKGFEKVWLKPGEETAVYIPFDDKTFRYWNVKTNCWEVEGGNYEISIGTDVETTMLSANMEIQGTTEEIPYTKELLPSYYAGNVKNVSDKEFTVLLGHAIPTEKWGGTFEINDTVCQMYYGKNWIARLIYHILTKRKERSEKNGTLNLNIHFIYNIPLRAIAKMTEGAVSMEMVEGMVTVINGHFLTGMKKIIGGYFRNQRENKEYEEKLRKGMKEA